MAFEIDNTVLNANALVVQENRFLIRSACDVDADFARATDDSVTVAVGVMTWFAMNSPTHRAALIVPSDSAMSPYVVTRPRGI